MRVADCSLCLKVKRNIAEDVLLSLDRTSPWHFGKKLSWLLRCLPQWSHLPRRLGGHVWYSRGAWSNLRGIEP